MTGYTCDLDHRPDMHCRCAFKDRGPACPQWRVMTEHEREESREKVRNDPTISDMVKRAMEQFWRLVDERRR